MRIRIWSNIRHAVSKSGHFTHDMTFFHQDVRGKRFNTHGKLHRMEMTISKDHVAGKPRRGASNKQARTDSYLELQISYLFINLFSGRFVKAVTELHRSKSGDICDGAYSYAGRAGI